MSQSRSKNHRDQIIQEIASEYITIFDISMANGGLQTIMDKRGQLLALAGQ